MKKKKLGIASIIAVITGLLGAYAGADKTSKAWRRVGIPLLFGILTYIISHSLIISLSVLSLFIVLSMGYGIPDSSDEGSSLGRFWYNILDKNEFRATMATQTTIATLEMLCLIPIAIHFETGLLAFYGLLLLNLLSRVILTYAKPMLTIFTFFGKDLLQEEFIRYAILGLIVGLIIL